MKLKKGDLIKLKNEKKAVVIYGYESNYEHCCIIKLENGQIRVIDTKHCYFLEDETISQRK
jgi:hypothetical protein